MSRTVKPKSAWQRIRQFFNDIHLWLGLASGIIVILICFSGTIYVFNTEAKEMAAPELYHVQSQKGATVLEMPVLLALVKEHTGGKVLSVRIPADADRAYQFSVRMPEAESEKEQKSKGHRNNNDQTIIPGSVVNKIRDVNNSKNRKEAPSGEREEKKGNAKREHGGKPGAGPGKRPSVFAVNQYTGTAIGDLSAHKSFTAELMKTMFSLHRWLLLDKVEEPIFGTLENRKLGSYISGTATILFTLGVITGMVIWFPQKLRSWKQGLKVKWKGSWKRTNHDLHNTLGFYACIFLFLMGVTGPQWSFQWYRTALRQTLGTYQPEGSEPPADPVSVIPAPGKRALSISDFLKKSNEVLPYVGDVSISFPKDSLAAVTILKNRVGFFAPVAGDKLLLDQYTAEVLKVDVFRDKPFKERVSASIKALHIGDVYGLFTKIIYFLACLIATSLPVTGTLIWLNKLKKKKKPVIKAAAK